MLTSDLLRTKISDQYVIPRYIKETDANLLQMTKTMLSMYEQHIGKKRGELQNCFDEVFGQSSKVIVLKGLFKILEDLSEYASLDNLDPVELRQILFRLAAQKHQQGIYDRSKIINEIAERQKLSSDEVEMYLFADLRDNQVISDCKKMSAEVLLKRYNTALAQALLYKAVRLEINIREENLLRYRQLFRSIKFCQLLYTITGNTDSGFSIVLDGPMSIFKASQKYGLSMALFLPSLLLCKNWECKAYVLWGKRKIEKIFKIHYNENLYSHYPDTGMYCPPEIKAFEERFVTLDSDWTISSDCEFIELESQTICIPDYVFRHRKNNCTVYLEIFSFWRRAALEKRLQQQLQDKHYNILLAVCDKLNVDKKVKKQDHQNIYYYKTVLVPKKVLELLESFAKNA